MEEVGLGREGTWETGRLSPASGCYCIRLLCKVRGRCVEFRAPSGGMEGWSGGAEGCGCRGEGAGPHLLPAGRRAPAGA